LKYDIQSLSVIYALLETDGIGPQRIINLLKHFSSPTDLLHAKINNISEIEGFNEILANRIIRNLEKIIFYQDEFEKQQEAINKHNIKLLHYWDDDYPKNLRNIYYPPIFLYLKGELKKIDEISVAIVGTRKPSSYGKNVAREFSMEISRNHVTVISGMARGIDSIAHRGALENNGRTIAVVGSGLDVIYPPENDKLFNQIVENGCVISEFKLGTQPDASNFPQRNRIISGLSKGVLIIETKIIGGAMQTANHALDQGREVYAVPGDIHNIYSEGTNYLIQQGNAELVLSAKDILREMKIDISTESTERRKKIFEGLSLFEQNIIDKLTDKQMQIDQIAEQTKLSVPECLVNLLNLEFKGYIRQLPGKYFEVIY